MLSTFTPKYKRDVTNKTIGASLSTSHFTLHLKQETLFCSTFKTVFSTNPKNRNQVTFFSYQLGTR